MSADPTIPNEALDVFEDVEAKHTSTHGGDYRRCCTRAGLAAAYPHLVGRALVDFADEVLVPMREQAAPQYGSTRSALKRAIEALRRHAAEMLDDKPEETTDAG